MTEKKYKWQELPDDISGMIAFASAKILKLSPGKVHDYKRCLNLANPDVVLITDDSGNLRQFRMEPTEDSKKVLNNLIREYL